MSVKFQNYIKSFVEKKALKNLIISYDAFPIESKDIVRKCIYYFGKNKSDVDKNNIKFATKTIFRQEYKKLHKRLKYIEKTVEKTDNLNQLYKAKLVIYFKILAIQKPYNITKSFIEEQCAAMSIFNESFNEIKDEYLANL